MERIDDNSVTAWVLGLKTGDPQAAERLWERYYHDLVRIARAKLQGAPRGRADESDVALDAFHSFCRDAREGAFPEVTDRGDFWRLMMLYTARKASDQIRRERRLARGGGRVAGESVFDAHDGSGEAVGIAQVIGREPSPEFAAMLAETVQRCLSVLADDHRPVAVLAMEGFTNQEIATRQRCSVSTIERRLRNIRQILRKELADDASKS